jgi:hypothetical protein
MKLFKVVGSIALVWILIEVILGILVGVGALILLR